MVPDGGRLLIVLFANGNSQLALQQLQRLWIIIPATCLSSLFPVQPLAA